MRKLPIRRIFIVLQGPKRFDCLCNGNLLCDLGEQSKEISSTRQHSTRSCLGAPTTFPPVKIPPFRRKSNRMRLQDHVGRWIRQTISTGVSRRNPWRWSPSSRAFSFDSAACLLSIGQMASFNSSSVVSMSSPCSCLRKVHLPNVGGRPLSARGRLPNTKPNGRLSAGGRLLNAKGRLLNAKESSAQCRAVSIQGLLNALVCSFLLDMFFYVCSFVFSVFFCLIFFFIFPFCCFVFLGPRHSNTKL